LIQCAKPAVWSVTRDQDLAEFHVSFAARHRLVP
jgi:hypothetical protein